jgi:hypothetical protein
MNGTLDWENKTVIGFKAKAPKVARNAADLNGTSRWHTSLFSLRSSSSLRSRKSTRDTLWTSSGITHSPWYRHAEPAPSLRQTRKPLAVGTRLIPVRTR